MTFVNRSNENLQLDVCKNYKYERIERISMTGYDFSFFLKLEILRK